MSWNIEILVITPGFDNPDEIGIFDVSVFEDKPSPFWAVSSYLEIGEKMGSSITDERVIIVDPSCRLLKALPVIVEESGDRKVVFCRVSSDGIRRIFINGEELDEEAIRAKFPRQPVPEAYGKLEDMDGEQLGWVFLNETTGLELWGRGQPGLNEIESKIFGP